MNTQTLIKVIAWPIYKIDTLLYKWFGFVSPTRREYWDRRAIQIQMDLASEHTLARINNERHNTVYTTKKALELE